MVKYPWDDEPTPLCDDELLSLYDETETRRIAVDADFARCASTRCTVRTATIGT